MSRRTREPGPLNPHPQAYKSAVLADEPVAYWPLDDAGTWADISGNGRPSFTATGTVPDGGSLHSPWGSGSAGFSGSTANQLSIASGSTSFMNLTPPFTLEFIANSNDAGGTGFDAIAAYESSNDAGGNRSWTVYMENGRVSVYKVGEKWYEGNPASISNNVTYHIVVQILSTRIVTVYLNGLRDNIAFTTYASEYDASVTAPLRVGVSTAGDLNNNLFFPMNGEVADFAAYNKQLGPERILAHAEAAGLA